MLLIWKDGKSLTLKGINMNWKLHAKQALAITLFVIGITIANGNAPAEVIPFVVGLALSIAGVLLWWRK